ncbi:hypothetical protein PVAND_001210 [Polypedilum vanderplanki]|uniref:Shootin-1 n=1 Tax=Polypedilum vanderplanki TaxID=319348 RepID=A0A9J6BMN8_POLVA|nr:hypothetical protein PVAND_001210 [Polypedilum vanderplanki]
MADSPTNRKSSIPILKQSNKTKSFQSYVSLNLNDDSASNADRKSRSPSTSPTENVQTKSLKAQKQSIPKLEIDNDIVITKLCDENKRLKDHQTQLISKYEEALRENMEIQNKNDELQRELLHFRRENSEKLQLQKTIENLQKQQIDMIEKNKKLQKKLEEILPESIKDEVSSYESSRANLDIMMELEKLKSYLNNVELQLYEANEHIADLLEKKQELEAENLNLKSENGELKNLTKLMQANMYETLNTSKRMEETFLLIKSERDELIKRQSINRDSTDGKTTTVTEEIANLKTELKRQKAHYEAQFIEYKTNVEKEMELKISSELETLKVQIQLLETELEISRMRAENAEEELRQLKATIRMSASKFSEMDAVKASSSSTAPIAPPPPPPLPNFNVPTTSTNTLPTNKGFRSRSNSQTLSDAISDAQHKLQHGTMSNETKEKTATGLEAVINDLKNGRVTLRRRQPRPTIPISPKEDYKDIYQLLERNQKQNRSSVKILNNELSKAFKKFNINI